MRCVDLSKIFPRVPQVLSSQEPQRKSRWEFQKLHDILALLFVLQEKMLRFKTASLHYHPNHVHWVENVHDVFYV
jgi:hypothetical protein